MKMSEIRELTTKELEERIEAEKIMLTRLKINHAVSPLDNPMKIRHTRRDIARMLTELRKRQLAGNTK
ncbi:MAG: 50S ribosomal protein L29 [Bacteroidales bacterium]